MASLRELELEIDGLIADYGQRVAERDTATAERDAARSVAVGLERELTLQRVLLLSVRSHLRSDNALRTHRPWASLLATLDAHLGEHDYTLPDAHLIPGEHVEWCANDQCEGCKREVTP